jgi:pimeloyl-ACP methyl ester carboxylesterase
VLGVPASRPHPLSGRRRRALLATLIATALALTACTATVGGSGTVAAAPAPSISSTSPSTAPSSGSPSASSIPEPTVGLIKFTDCTQVLTKAAINISKAVTLSCGRLNVPLNYNNPNGPTIGLEVVKAHYKTAGSLTGSLLINPGGPGGDGIELLLGLVTQMSTSVLSHFDLIGFDPRGVGLSTPVVCTSNAQKDQLNAASPNVLTTAGFAQAKQAAADTAAACQSQYGPALPQINTVNTARDMDLIRQGVGDAQMNYLGFSYGTELGAQYAHLFPDKIRAFVLDGAVDPLTDSTTQFADQMKGFEASFDQFAAKCLTTSPCQTLGNPRQVVYSIVATVTRDPMPTGSSRPLTENLALTGVLEALYDADPVTELGNALIAARQGNGAKLLALADGYNQRFADGTYTNLADSNLAISCNDSPPGPTDAQVHATATAWSKAYPMFGTWAAAALFSCQSWQPVRTVPPLPTAPATSAKVLVIGNLHDPATPYQGALDLAKTLGNAEVLTWNGEGHTSYLEGSTCVDNAVNSYLVGGTLPAAGTTCPA